MSFKVTVELARKLAPYSPRLRALLVLVERHRHRTMDARHPVHALQKLCHEVMAEHGLTPDGRTYAAAIATRPKPVGYDDGLAWMRDVDYVRTHAWREQQYFARRQGADERLTWWLDAIISHFAKNGVPLMPWVIKVSPEAHAARLRERTTSLSFEDCPFCHGFAVELSHCLYGVALPSVCWEIIAAVGDEIATKQGIVMESNELLPEEWVVGNWQALRAAGASAVVPDDFDFARSPSGERAMLLRDYGLLSDGEDDARES